MDYRQFEREFLRLAFTTSVNLSPASMAFLTGIRVSEAERHMQSLVSQGVLELESDEEGHLRYCMPDRPRHPFVIQENLASRQRIIFESTVEDGAEGAGGALVLRTISTPFREPQDVSSGQAVASLFLNAMVCPGVGSLVGGKTGTGLAQLSLFLVGLPLAVLTIGLPLMVAAWVWGIATGAQIIAESRE